ncbi:sterol desaturase family protein [Dietzia sp.]|uniref:sterol desaturase family protein n=1 Tax=Dietzia sp. TaxID=1871616 RepID=UPI002FD98567
MRIDLTVVAVPAYVAAMGAEYAWQRRHPAAAGSRAGDYELKDTMASLSMGLGSLLAPHVSKALFGRAERRARFAKAGLGLALAGGAAATAVDVVRRHRRGELPEPGRLLDMPDQSTPGGTSPAPYGTNPTPDSARPSAAPVPLPPVLRRIGGAAGVSAVASAALVVATEWGAATASSRIFGRTRADLGRSLLAYAAGILGWDFVYYWNHRLSHEVRWLWAVHSVHHSSERYNLSTALRQPWGEALTLFVPYSVLALAGVRPSVLADARAVNLIYQFWVHTEAIDSLGWAERVFNTPSHHRAHHGSNQEYLDQNHGSILIVWDKLFGTFSPEDARVVYGLTANIDTFNPLRVFWAEWGAIVRDIWAAESWRERWSFLLRGPGWAYENRRIA